MKMNFFLLAMLVITAAEEARAAFTTLSSAISMDNGFVAYISTSDSVAGTAFTSGNNWPTTVFGTTSVLADGIDYYLHVYGYDEGGPAGFLGQFSLSGAGHKFSNGTTSLLTNLADWKANTTGFSNPYSAPSDLGSNGAGPWGTISGISNTARWIWSGDNDDNDFAYFSTKITAVSVPSPVPEPMSIAIWSLGALGLVFAGRKRRQLLLAA